MRLRRATLRTGDFCKNKKYLSYAKEKASKKSPPCRKLRKYVRVRAVWAGFRLCLSRYLPNFVVGFKQNNKDT